MSTNVDKAASVSPPKEIFIRTTVTSTAEFELPPKFEGNWITVQAHTTDVWIRFAVGIAGTALGQSLDETSQSAVTSEVIIADADGAWLIFANTEQPYDLSQLGKLQANQAIKVFHKSPDVLGKLRIIKSSGPTG